MRKISKFILQILGWKIEGVADLPRQCIFCVAPHTSNWDLIIGKMVAVSLGLKTYFLIKKTWFFFPVNLILNAIGGISVDRSKKNSLTEQLADEFSKQDNFVLAVTPEATRKRNSDWKKGFYYIALAAKIPIVIAVMDYKYKTVYFKAVLMPTGDVDKDMAEIKMYYKGATGKHPQNFTTGD